MTYLSLSLLGTFDAKLDGKPLDGFRSNKARALLAYLAVEARSHSRAHLAGLLWPEWPEVSARTYVRQAVGNLRQILGDRNAKLPFLLVTRQSIQFNGNSNCRVDVVEVQKSVGEIDSVTPQLLHAKSCTALEQALALYNGNFLDGFFIDDCATFEEWRLLTREQLQHQVTKAVGLLADAYTNEGNFVKALAYARQRVTYDPWQEEGHRQIMRLLALIGEHGQALSHYESYRQNTDVQLAIIPAPETTILYEQIKAGEYPEQHQPIDGPTLATQPQTESLMLPAFLEMSPQRSPNRFPFVAREKELANMESHLNKALSGQGRVIFLAGDAGSGKTSLLHEFLQLAQKQHPRLIVASGNCSAYSGVGDPYLPLRELLAALTGDVEAKWLAGALTRQQIVQLWSALPNIIENLITRGADLINSLLHGPSLLERLSESMPAEQEWLVQVRRQIDQVNSTDDTDITLRQIDLFEQLTIVLQKIARSHPLIIAVDDLQWADPGSLSFLFHLGRRLEGVPFLVVGAYRPEEIASGRDEERHPLMGVLHEFALLWGDIIVDLNASDGYQFVRALLEQLPNRLDNDFGEQLFQRCAGHALFTTEIVESLLRRGDLVRNEEGYWINATPLKWEAIPARIEAIIAERIDRLPEELQIALTIACVEGEYFTAELVAQLLHENTHELIQRLSSELDRHHHLIRAEGVQHVGGKRLSQYRFCHILFQDFLYKTLDDVERAHWHEAVAQVLEAYYVELAESNTSYAVRLAWHFQQAGATDKAILYLSRAGTRAMQLFANREAIEHFTNALVLLEAKSETMESLHQELQIEEEMGIAMGIIHGHAAPALEQHLVRAEALASQLNDKLRLLPASWRLWQYYHVKGQFYTAYDRAWNLKAQAEQSEEMMYMLAAQQSIGNTAFALGKLPVTRAYLEKTFVQLSTTEERTFIHKFGMHPGVLSRIFLALTCCCMGLPDRGLQTIHKALHLAEQVEHPFTFSFALVGALGVHLFRREPHKTLKYAEKAIEFCRAQQIRQWIPHSIYGRGLALAMLGNAVEGIEEAEKGFLGWQQIGSLLWGARMRAVFADVCLQAGDLQRAERLLTEALDHVAQTGERLYEAELYRLRGELWWQQSRGVPNQQMLSEIEASLLLAIDIAQKQQAKLWELRATVSLSRLLIEQGKEVEPYVQLKAIYEWFTEGFDTLDLIEAKVLLDEFSSSSGVPEENYLQEK